MIMKKQFFGYRIADVDIILDSLRSENESLNAAIAALKKESGSKDQSQEHQISLLEEELNVCRSSIMQLNEKVAELEAKLALSEQINR